MVLPSRVLPVHERKQFYMQKIVSIGGNGYEILWKLGDLVEYWRRFQKIFIEGSDIEIYFLNDENTSKYTGKKRVFGNMQFSLKLLVNQQKYTENSILLYFLKRMASFRSIQRESSRKKPL